MVTCGRMGSLLSCLAAGVARCGQCYEHGNGRPAERWRVKGGSKPRVATLVSGRMPRTSRLISNAPWPRVCHSPSVFGGLMIHIRQPTLLERHLVTTMV